MSRFSRLGLFLLAAAVLPAARAADVKVGDKAPDFTLTGTDGKSHSLSDFKGKKAVVLAWFPKAATPGCTVECKSFRENGAALKEKGVAYFTISVDKPEANKSFAENLDLDYPILSDPDKKVAKEYGVLGNRPVAQRWTFYIDKEGVIKHIDKDVKTKTAATDVVKKLDELGIAK